MPCATRRSRVGARSARHYDTVIGRFLSADSIVPGAGNPQALNRYSYVLGNPMKYVDPTGYDPSGLDAGAGACDSLRCMSELMEACGAEHPCYEINERANAQRLFWKKERTGTLSENENRVLEGLLSELTIFDNIRGIYTGELTRDQRVAAMMSASEFAPVAGMAAGKVIANGAADAVEAVAGNTFGRTLKPGPYAKESIPARGPDRNFTMAEKAEINRIGNTYGCHTCGTKDPGTVSGDWVLDHQPPNRLNVNQEPQQLLPQCLHCMHVQGGEVREYIRQNH